ncbi:hypothetical protein AB0O31_28730 [Kitasatospora cineracea]|uniref:hypothetical protein n=1 Tax=Kitasatospora cineracea TaxID=88074 RepID=UPI0034397010
MAGGRPSVRAWAAVAVLAAGLVPATGIVAEAASAPSKGPGQLFAEPDSSLGRNWRKGTDVSVIGAGDTAGFHILRADESSGFAYKEVALLQEDALSGIGLWTGYVCTTGSGRYAAAVYAPSMVTNKPGMAGKDAFAAVVDLSTGKVTKAVTGVELAYFSPGCGSTEDVAFTRSEIGDDGKGTTTVYDVSAATGKVLRTTTVDGQFTNPLPDADGKDLGVLHGNLVKLNGKERPTALAALPGQVFGLAQSNGGAIDLAVVEEGKDAVHRWDGKAMKKLGTAPIGSLGLFSQTTGDLVAGVTDGIDTSKAPGLAKAVAPTKPVGASRSGRLLTTAVTPSQLNGVLSKVGPVADASDAGQIEITALATATGDTGTAQLSVAATDATAADVDDVEPTFDGHTEHQSLMAQGVQLENENPNTHYSNCIVPRNAVDAQALQPSTNMVEWAVDQAVHGRLTVTRPDNYLSTKEPAHSPQGLFPLVALTGGGTIPAQVMLGIVAQESNLKQASWHAMPGDAGNPTLGDYFGNHDDMHHYPIYGQGDCGYGIAQVTAGMSSSSGGFTYSAPEAYAIATDYAANIAAGTQILSKTWNQLKSLDMNVNSGATNHIENWYMALWGYNSGVYTDSSLNDGHVGVGWLNNPANPHYPADRQPFLRASYDDARTPGNWPYQERVLGWAETPQLTYNATPSYVKPYFATSPLQTTQLNLSIDHFLFCDSSNSCIPHQTPDACPAENSSCWWHKSVSWFSDTDTTSGVENLAFALGSGEPPLNRKYSQPPCNSAPGTLATIVIDDLPDPNDNVFGCNESRVPPKGKFNLRLGDNIVYTRSDGSVRATGDIAVIDLHQIGGGYDGHFWFTHNNTDTTTNQFHRVTASWTIDPGYLPRLGQQGQRFDIYVHIPDHGADGIALYTVNPGYNNAGEPVRSCPYNQGRANGANAWMELGTVQMWAGASLQADNISQTYNLNLGDKDIAFDAVAFVPASAPSTTGPCWKY